MEAEDAPRAVAAFGDECRLDLRARLGEDRLRPRAFEEVVGARARARDRALGAVEGPLARAAAVAYDAARVEEEPVHHPAPEREARRVPCGEVRARRRGRGELRDEEAVHEFARLCDLAQRRPLRVRLERLRVALDRALGESRDEGVVVGTRVVDPGRVGRRKVLRGGARAAFGHGHAPHAPRICARSAPPIVPSPSMSAFG